MTRKTLFNGPTERTHKYIRSRAFKPKHKDSVFKKNNVILRSVELRRLCVRAPWLADILMNRSLSPSSLWTQKIIIIKATPFFRGGALCIKSLFLFHLTRFSWFSLRKRRTYLDKEIIRQQGRRRNIRTRHIGLLIQAQHAPFLTVWLAKLEVPFHQSPAQILLEIV